MKKLNKYQITKQIKIFESTVIKAKKKPLPIWIRTLGKTIFAFLVIFSCNVLIYKSEDFFVKLVPDKQEWAVAMIALPIALFGMYLPLFISQKKKFSTIVANQTIKDLYFNSLRIGDLSYLFVIHAFINLLYWFLSFLASNHACLTAYALFLTIDLLYLIFDAVHKLGISSSKLYAKYILSIYYSSIYNPQIEANCVKTMIQNSNTEDIEIQGVKKIAYENLYDEIQKMYISAISEANDTIEKDSIIEVFQMLSDLKTKKFNILAVSRFFDLLPIIYDSAIEKQDYCFVVSLTDKIMNLWNIIIEELAYYQKNYCTEIKPLLQNQDNSTLNELQEIEKINNIFYDRLQAYYTIANYIIYKIDISIDRLSNCQLFNQLQPNAKEYKEGIQAGKNILKTGSEILTELKLSNSKIFRRTTI